MKEQRARGMATLNIGKMAFKNLLVAQIKRLCAAAYGGGVR